MDSEILAELRRIASAVEQLVELQQALLAALADEQGENEEQATDLEGNALPPDRDEGDEL